MNPTPKQWNAFQPIRKRSDLLVLRSLREGLKTQGVLAQELGLNVSSVSRSLATLAEDGLVGCKDGLYGLKQPWGQTTGAVRDATRSHIESVRGVLEWLEAPDA